MHKQHFKRTKLACFFAYPALTPVFILPPMLFVIFRQLYGISYTLLGALVLINFCTQMGVDLIFTFFPRRFNIHKTIRAMPLLTAAGLIIYALSPTLLPQLVYPGLVLGTVIFSISAGLCEVFISPTVAALPSDNPERDMSALHSLYGYGAAVTALISTLFLHFLGAENWRYLVLFWAAFPVISFVLFFISPLPEISMETPTTGRSAQTKRIGLMLCMLCIFLGSAAENTMTNWISTYMDKSLQLPKMVSDALGLAGFTLLLALTRTAYARFGKHIYPVLLSGMAGAAICYLTAGLSSNLSISTLACMLTGICTSMLWPGTLILMEEKIPNPGVAAYALMAAGGDFGASVAPQGMGIIVDAVSASSWAAALGKQFSLSAEQIAMKTGMLIAAVFPVLGVILLLCMGKFFQTTKKAP